MATACILTACGGSQLPAVETVYSETRVEGTVEKTVAELSVQGMMCEIGCVAKVQKELLEVPGVASAKINFEKDRALNTALVSSSCGWRVCGGCRIAFWLSQTLGCEI